MNKVISDLEIIHKNSGSKISLWTSIKPDAFSITHSYNNAYTNSPNGTYISIGEFNSSPITFTGRIKGQEDKDKLVDFITSSGELYTIHVIVDGMDKYLDVGLDSINIDYTQYGFHRPITITVKPLYYWYSKGINILNTETNAPIIDEDYPYTYAQKYAYEAFFVNGAISINFTNNRRLDFPLIIEIIGGNTSSPEWIVTNGNKRGQIGGTLIPVPSGERLIIDSRHLEQTAILGNTNWYNKMNWEFDNFIYLENGTSTISISNVENVKLTTIELSVMP
jgi:hypothetical protein